MLSTLITGFMLSQLPQKPLTLVGGLDIKAKPFKIVPSKSRATVLFFIATDCPVANRYAPEIGRISKSYAQKGVRSFRVYVLDKGHTKEIAQHGKEFGLAMPAILDPKRKLVSETGVKITPEVAVISAKGKLIYRGRIDDQNVEHGVIRQGYRQDLRIALDEFLSGKSVSIPSTAAIGCFL